MAITPPAETDPTRGLAAAITPLAFVAFAASAAALGGVTAGSTDAAGAIAPAVAELPLVFWGVTSRGSAPTAFAAFDAPLCGEAIAPVCLATLLDCADSKLALEDGAFCGVAAVIVLRLSCDEPHAVSNIAVDNSIAFDFIPDRVRGLYCSFRPVKRRRAERVAREYRPSK